MEIISRHRLNSSDCYTFLERMIHSAIIISKSDFSICLLYMRYAMYSYIIAAYQICGKTGQVYDRLHTTTRMYVYTLAKLQRNSVETLITFCALQRPLCPKRLVNNNTTDCETSKLPLEHYVVEAYIEYLSKICFAKIMYIFTLLC